MTEQNTPGSNENGPSENAAPENLWSVTPPPPAASDEDTSIGFTQPLPPYQQPVSPAFATAPARRTGGITAAVLAGALLLGGAAGVGGAAWYDAWNGDDHSSALAGTPTSNGAVNAATLPSGSVEKVAATVLPSVVKINVSGSSGSGSGSGIVLSKDGNILTNNHVVALASGGGSMTVSFNDGSTVKASVIGTDPVTDLAVIKAEGVKDLTPATIGSSSALKVGQAVVAVGSPYGLNATVTTGIVSALNRPVSVSTEEQQTNPFGFGQQQQQPNDSTTYPAIQTDAAINPGNSGGPLVNLAGQVVGVNSSIRTADGTSTSGGSIGLGFAIPIDELRPIIEQILNNEDPTHARLAITVSDVAQGKLTQGAQVREVQSGGAADKAGLKAGDVITKVDDDVIDGSESLIATIRGHRPGEEVTVTYVRDGKTETVRATLGSDANTHQR
jgi:putative serine protease PepD